MAVVAVPLLGAGTAQAAIAGAPPEKTTTRPDLISATILSQSSAGSAVDFCFDKSVANPGGGGQGGSFGTFAKFQLGGYRSENSTGDTSGHPGAAATGAALEQNSSGNTPPFNCVRVTFPGAAGDLNQYTIGTVQSGAVLAQGGNVNNVDDSTPLTGSTTHNGTSGQVNGFTAAPDLTGVNIDQTSNTITYVEDQAVAHQGGFISFTPGDNGFFFVDGAGNTCYATGGAAAVSGNLVTVSFSPDKCTTGGFSAPTANPPTENVSDAVRAGQGYNVVTSANDPNAGSTEDELPVPNAANGGNTAKPDLLSTTLESNGQAMDFVFDANVNPTNVSCFAAGLSTGDEVTGNSAQVIAVSTTQTTVRVTFPNFSTYDEYVVKGIVFAGCAVSNGSGAGAVTNTPGSQPAGDNAGAFARGFTTGADVFSAVLNKGTGVANISLDQRAFNTNNTDPNNVMLLDNTGNVIAHAQPGGLTFPSQAAGPETITAQFTQAQVGNAANLAVINNDDPAPDPQGAAFTTNLSTGSGGNCIASVQLQNDCTDQPNVSQILSVTTTAAMARQAHLANAAVKHHAAVRRGQARNRAHLRHLRAVSRARLAKIRRLAHHRH